MRTQTMQSFWIKSALAAMSLVSTMTLCSTTEAAVLLSSSTYTQDFDGLPSHTGTGTDFTWTDDSTLTGWYAENSAASTTFRADDGAISAGNIYSFGSVSSAERALGGFGGTHTWGARFQNGTGAAITGMSLEYTGEQWRDNGNTTAQSITFEYIITDSLVAIDSAGWTAVSALDFTGPQHSGSTTALDGNLAANQASVSGSINSISIPNNSYFWIRWTDVNHTSTDHALAIDDLTLMVPEPSSMVLIVGAVLACSISRRA